MYIGLESITSPLTIALTGGQLTGLIMLLVLAFVTPPVLAAGVKNPSGSTQFEETCFVIAGTGAFFCLLIWLAFWSIGAFEGEPLPSVWRLLSAVIALIGGSMATKVLLVSYRAGSAPGMGIGLGIAVALVAVLAIVLFGPPQEDVAIVSDGDDVSDHPAEFVKGQIASLEASIAKEIPSFRLRLEEQAGNVRRQVDAASSESQRRLLRDELAEIARTIIALEDHEREVERILAQLKSTERRLARLRDAKSYLGPEDEKLREELATIANDLNLELSSALDERIGSGAITDARVDAKLAELLAEDKE